MSDENNDVANQLDHIAEELNKIAYDIRDEFEEDKKSKDEITKWLDKCKKDLDIISDIYIQL